MNRLPSEMAQELKAYVLNNDITGKCYWDILDKALPNDEDMHEFIIQCIFNELDMSDRPNSFDIAEGTKIITTSDVFAEVIELGIRYSTDFAEYEYRDGRVYNIYDDCFCDE